MSQGQVVLSCVSRGTKIEKMTLYFAFTHGLEIWNEKNVGLQELRFNAHYCPCRH
jgi:hypothetical protein